MGELPGTPWNKLREKFSFVSEIFEQPAAMENLISHYVNGDGRDQLVELANFWQENGFSRIYISGMGSSLFAGQLLALQLQSAGYPVGLVDSGELLYHVLGDSTFPEDGSGTLFLLISQSGESGEIVKLLDRLSQVAPKATTWGITNTHGSTLDRRASRCLFLHAGRETSVTSKTFCNSLLLMYLLGKLLGRVLPSHTESNHVNQAKKVDEVLENFKKESSKVIGVVSRILEKDIGIGDKMVEFLGKETRFIEIIGRGPSLASGWQAALNFKETVKIPAECLSTGQFRHGPIEMIDQDFRAILLSPGNEWQPMMEDLAWNITHRWGGGKVIMISNDRAPRLEGEPRILSIIHDVEHPFLAPVVEIVILQLAMVRMAVENDLEPGVFRYSSKITKEG